MADGGRARRAVQVVQTSVLDCGPASLASLLRGLGIPASYEVLRDLCATDVDGTSIDSVESVAVAAGVDAQQMVVPAEHVLAQPDEYLPAVAVTLLPDGFTHFVVLWARHGRWVEVMDPAVGRRRVRVDRLAAELYRHTLPVPAAAWREWAGGEVFTTGLRRRLAAVGVRSEQATHLLDEACAVPGPEPLAALDAALRIVENDSRADLLEVLAEVRAAPGSAPPEAWSCTPAGDGSLALHGAVIVRARHWTPANGDPALLARLAVPEPGAREVLAGAVPRVRALALGVTAAGAALALGHLLQDVLLLPFVETTGDPDADRPAAVLTGVLLAVAGLSLGARWWVLRLGRRAEGLLHRRLAAAVGRLPDAWVRSRPASDLAERGHLLHRLRELPGQAYEAAVGLATVTGATALAVALAPQATVPLALLLAVCVTGPLLAARAAAERDLRMRTLAGTLAMSTQDALLGAEAVAANGFAAAVRDEHRRTLERWRVAARSAVLFGTGVRAAVDAPAAVLGGLAVVLAAGTTGTARALLVGLLAFRVLDAGGQLADLLRSAPAARSSLARVAAWLAAEPASERVSELESGPAGGSVVRLVDAGLDAGPTVVLDGLDVDLPAGVHVGVVGASGSGKTTLLGVLTGLVDVTRGSVHRTVTDPADIAWVAPDTRLWNDTLAANVGYGSPTARPAPVAELLQAAEADGVGVRSGAGLLGEGGRLLSDGEGQRVRLARALGRPDARLVVLDEPFQGLERDRRRRLLRLARSWWAGATLVCATHDVEDTLELDLVLVMDGGRLVESGPPAELAARPEGRYRALLDAGRRDPFGAHWRVLDLGRAGAAAVPSVTAAGR